jgi:hypothetical protein
MSIVSKIRSTKNRRSARGHRSDLMRAIAAAPTRASREELLNLANMGR